MYCCLLVIERGGSRSENVKVFKAKVKVFKDEIFANGEKLRFLRRTLRFSTTNWLSVIGKERVGGRDRNQTVWF